MAYIPEDYNEDEEQTGGGQTTTGTQGALISGPSRSSANKGSGFVNFQDYVSANQNKSEGLAKEVGSGVQNRVGEAQDTFNQGYQNFQQKSDQNKLFNTQGMQDKIQSNNFAGVNQQNWQKLQGGYSGPKTFDQNDQQSMMSAKNKALEGLSNLQTQEGRHTLLKDTIQDPTYRRGESRLDSALLTGDKGAQAHFQTFNPKADELKGDYQGKVQQAQDVYNQNKQNWETRRGEIDTMLRGQAKKYQQSLEDRARQKNQEVQNQFRQAETMLSRSPSTSFGQGESFGGGGSNLGSGEVDIGGGQIVARNDLGVDMRPYLSDIQRQYGVQDVATPEERAQAQALAQLTGDQNYEILGDAYQGPAYTFDRESYAQALAQEQARLDEAARLERERQQFVPEVQASVDQVPGQIGSGGSGFLENVFGGWSL